MKTNVMRAPLLKAAAVLLVFVLLAYLTSASPEGSVLNSVGLLIIGAFRLVQWTIAMAIGLGVCIAFLIGIFLFAASLVDKQASASMSASLKQSLGELTRPVFAAVGAMTRHGSQCASQSVQAGPDNGQLKEELRTIIAGQVQQVTQHQQALLEQLAALNTKIQALEQKSEDFAAAGQLEAIAGEISAAEKMLGTVRESVAALEGKVNSTMQQVQALSPEKMLGDLPSRLEKLEKEGEFDPTPLNESIQLLQKDLEEIKKKSTTPGKSRKKS